MPFWFPRLEGERLARELYDPSFPGAAAVPHFIRPEERGILALHAGALPLEEVPAIMGVVRQGLLHGWAGPADLPGAATPGIRRLREYARACAGYLTGEGFPPLDWNSIEVQRYPRNSFGMGPHRDGASYRTLLGILALEGTGHLGVCRRRSSPREVLVEYDLLPGSMALLRAPRTDAEEGARPLHYLRLGPYPLTLLVFREWALPHP